MKWSEYVEGSVQDTIFEGEDWVGFFANQGTPDMAASYFNAWFRRRWEMSASECCSVCELRPTTWEERCAMAKLFGGCARVSIKLFLDKATLGRLSLDYFGYYSHELRDLWLDFGIELTPKGNIAVLASLSAPHPDSDSECIFRIYSPTGVPVTDWISDWHPIATSGYCGLVAQN